MPHLERKDVCEVVNVADEAPFREIVGTKGLLILPEQYGDGPQLQVNSDAGDFTKWIRTARPAIQISAQGDYPKRVLRSSDYWLPLVFLGTDVALPVYVHLVGAYIYEKMRGLLKGETAHVHFSAVYKDPKTGRVKRFNFEGDAQALEKTIKKFDLNQFFDE